MGAAGPRRRRLTLLLAVLVMAAGAAACGAPGPEAPGAGGGTGSGAGTEVLYWAALDLEPGPIAPYAVDPGGRPMTAAPGASSTWLRRLVHAGLMEAGPGGSLLPALAAEYRSSGDGLEHRFLLRPGAVYADGVAVTGGDVMAAWRDYLDLRPGAAGLVEALRWDSTAGEVVLILTEPAPWLVRALALAPVVPRDRDVGAGPFRAAGGAGDRWVLERVAGGEDGRLPAPARIEAAPVDQAQLPRLLDHGVHLVSGLTGAQVEALRPAWEASGYRATAVPRGWRLAALINPLRRPLDDPEVRRALAAALDRSGVARALGDAREVAGDDGAPDLEAALRRAGYSLDGGVWIGRRGETWEIRLLAADGLWADLPPGAAAAAADALAAGLRRKGLAVQVRMLDPDAFLSRVYEYRAFDVALLPVPLDETGQVAAAEAFLAVGGVPPLPGAEDAEGALSWLADPVVWALDRMDGVDYQVDEAAGLVRAGAGPGRKPTGEVEERLDVPLFSSPYLTQGLRE